MSYSKSRDLFAGPGGAPAPLPSRLRSSPEKKLACHPSSSPTPHNDSESWQCSTAQRRAISHHTSIRQQAQAPQVTGPNTTTTTTPESTTAPGQEVSCSVLQLPLQHIPTACPPESLWQERQPPADCFLQIHLIFHPARGRNLAAISIPLTSPFVLHGRDFQIDLREPLPGGGSQQVGDASSLASKLFLLTSEQHQLLGRSCTEKA